MKAGSGISGFREFEDELECLAAKDGCCSNFNECPESCDCIVCRTRTLLTEWEDHPLFAALDSQPQQHGEVEEDAG